MNLFGTLATRPAAGTSGRIYFATDTKIAYADDGANWVPRGIGILAASAVQVPHTGDTAEFTFATITVPANAMGANGRLRVSAFFSYTNSANNKTFRVRFGGTALKTDVLTTTVHSKSHLEIVNRNATNSQLASAGRIAAGWGASASAQLSSAIDTTAARDVTITGQLASAGESVNLEDYMVELIPG